MPKADQPSAEKTSAVKKMPKPELCLECGFLVFFQALEKRRSY